MHRQTILIVEDEINIAETLKDFLEAQGYELRLAATCIEAQQQIQEDPDLVILDWMLPDGQGLALMQRWRQEGYKQPVLFLTARSDIHDKLLGLECGADDYVTKPFDARELLARIKARLRSQHHVSPERFLVYGQISVNAQTREVTENHVEVTLTKIEYDLLVLFLGNQNRLYAREELLNKVWGYENYPTTRTVDNHIMQLRKKFKSLEFTTVHGVGYRLKVMPIKVIG
jgi:DNA-binding response OmpR family regulator